MTTTFTAPIEKIVEETPRVKSFYFSYPLQAEPGQFLKLTIPEVGERPFGAVIVDDKTFLISVGKVGAGTSKLHETPVGTTMHFSGPYGTFFTLPQQIKLPSHEKIHTVQKLALVAGGYGLAPLGYLAKKAAENGYHVTIFAGARSANEFLLYPFLTHPNITIVKSTDDGSAGIKGFVTEAFAQSISKTKFDMAYIVGPEIMELKIIDMCKHHDLPFQVSMEKYAYEEFGPVITHEKYNELHR